MKLSIGISYSTVNLQNYYTWFKRTGLDADVELIDLSYLQNNVEDFEKCDGFILTGGDDVDPELYDGPPNYPNMPPSFHPRRDSFEKLIIGHAIQHTKPLLGICRGLQLVNVFYGGKLIPDLADDGNAVHKSSGGIDQEHKVSIVPNTILHEITMNNKGITNSAHHQAAHNNFIGENLMVNSWDMTDIRIIEGLEFLDKTGKPFMLCVQWHPERMTDQQNPLAGAILKRFLQEVRETKLK